MYITNTTESIDIVLEGIEQVLAFRAKINVQREDITNISWNDDFRDWPFLLVRFPGSHLPSWIMAGSYWNKEGWDFVLSKKPKGLLKPTLTNVIVIKTDKPRYKRIILSMDKKKAIEIIRWWKRSRK